MSMRVDSCEKSLINVRSLRFSFSIVFVAILVNKDPPLIKQIFQVILGRCLSKMSIVSK